MNEFLLIAVTHLVGLISPGPDIALVIKTSLKEGRKAGILCSVGLVAAMAFHIVAVIVGYGAILSANHTLFTTVRVLGALYLLYLGLSGLRNVRKSWGLQPQEQASTVTLSKLKHPFVTGFVTNITNPKFTLFVILLFTQIVSPNTHTSIKLLYGLWMMAVATVWFCIAAIGFGSQRVRKLYARIGKWIDLVFSLILTLLGAIVLAEVISQ